MDASGWQRVGRLLGVFIVTALLLTFPSTAWAIVKDNTTSPTLSVQPPTAKYAPGRLIVKYKDTVTQCVHCLLQRKLKLQSATTDSSNSLDTLHARFRVQSVQPLFRKESQVQASSTTPLGVSSLRTSEQQSVAAIKAKFPARTKRIPAGAATPNLYHVYLLQLPQNTDIQQAAAEFAKDPHVEYAQPNYRFEVQWTPNDSYYQSQGSWGQPYDDLWGLKKLQTGSAWDRTKGQGVVVAVVDTGIDYTHPDIAANIWINPKEIPNNSRDDDGNGYIDDVRGWDFANGDNDASDGHGHGTHVSGTIAAVGNNSQGIIGVAPQAKIMAIKGIYDYGWGYSDQLAQALAYAAENGADVINNSWGGFGRSPVISSAISYAHGLGCVLVAAAGNSQADARYFSPANLAEVITVASSDHNDVKSSFSNWGSKIDVAAPGGDSCINAYDNFCINILSLRATGTDMYGTGKEIVGTNYYRAAGTSMATPHVAGVTALVLSLHPDFTNEGVRQVLRLSADDRGVAGWDNYYGFGRVNAFRATGISSTATAKILSPASVVLSQQATGTARIVIIGMATGTGFRQYELAYTPYPALSPWTALGAPATVPVSNGSLGTWDISKLQPGSYLLRLVVTTSTGQQFTDLAEVYVESYDYKRVTTDQSSLATPQTNISWNRIVWVDERNSIHNGDVYLCTYDPATGSCPDRRITSDTNNPELWPDISGDRIIYGDWRDNTAPPELYVYDLKTNTERRLTSVDLDPNSEPDIDGNLIVWGQGRNIYLYDLATDRQRQITSASWWIDWEPAVSGNRIVWASGRSTTPGLPDYDLYLCTYDPAIGSCPERRITTVDPTGSIQEVGFGVSNPAISGDLIVWQDNRNRNEDIYLYDLLTNKEWQLTTNSGHQLFPAVSGNHIVWEDWRHGLPNIYYCWYDRSTGSCREQRLTSHPSGQYFPKISGNKLIWFDRRYGPSEIYLFEVVLPDLFVEAIKFYRPGSAEQPADEVIPVPGQPVVVKVILKNLGGLASGAFKIKWHLNGVQMKFSSHSDLPPWMGISNDNVVRFNWTPTLGTHTFQFTADSDNSVIETNEGNNLRSCTVVILPDLAVTTVSGPTTMTAAAPTATVTTALKNQGTAAAGAFLIRLYLSADTNITLSDTLVGNYTVNSLGIGAVQTTNTSLTIPSSLPTGAYYWGAIADPNNLVKEVSETNNARVGNRIKWTRLDMTVNAVSGPRGSGISPDVVIIPGSNTSVTTTIRNSGQEASWACLVGLYLSPDATITTSDMRVGSYTQGAGLAVGATKTTTATVTIPTYVSPGTYYWGAIVDYNNALLEISETNNAKAGNTVTIKSSGTPPPATY